MLKLIGWHRLFQRIMICIVFCEHLQLIERANFIVVFHPDKQMKMIRHQTVSQRIGHRNNLFFIQRQKFGVIFLMFE